MIRINDKEFDAHGYISTDGIMSISFTTDESLDSIAKLFDEAQTVEIYDSYGVKAVDDITISGISPRKVEVRMSVGTVNEPVTISDDLDDAEPTVETKAPETVDEYAEAVNNGLMELADVPAELRDDVAIKLGV